MGRERKRGMGRKGRKNEWWEGKRKEVERKGKESEGKGKER